MRKSALIILVIIGMTSVGFAQDFSFRYIQEELASPQNENEVKNHYLGNEIANKMQLLKESYTHKELDEVADRERNVVEKPSIYYSVKKLNKHLKKEIKAGSMTEEEAFSELNNALNIALNIRYQDTQDLEDLLWKTKKGEEIAAVYSNRVALEM